MRRPNCTPQPVRPKSPSRVLVALSFSGVPIVYPHTNNREDVTRAETRVRIPSRPLCTLTDSLHRNGTRSFQCPDSPLLPSQTGLELNARCLGETLSPTSTSRPSVAACRRPASPRCRVNPMPSWSGSHRNSLLACPDGPKSRLALDRTAGLAVGCAHLGGSQGDGEGGA